MVQRRIGGCRTAIRPMDRPGAHPGFITVLRLTHNLRSMDGDKPFVGPGVSRGEQLCPQFVQAARDCERRTEFFSAAASILRKYPGVQFACVVEGTKGQWRLPGETGRTPTLPWDLLADVLDQQRANSDDEWMAAPLSRAPDNRHLLVLQTISNGASWNLPQLESVAQYIDWLGTMVGRQSRAQRRSQRLHSMLEMTTRWNQSRETETLLNEMATTSTSLLEAQRATIFLWDRTNQQLIGRPALGVSGVEIRVPEGAGVVGQVIATGQPRRVDADVPPEQSQIHRGVDRQLGFQTRSLLCVPMFDAAGRVIGAFELINKSTGSFTDDDLEALIELAASASVAISNTQQLQQLINSRRQIADQAAERIQWIGNSAKLGELRATVQRVAKTELAVLILGENGTGKEVVAQSIHYLSPRRDQVLVTVNCGAITETLLESELFGHEKGAFTDAHEARPGKFESANGGTLFLDEIGDMSLGGQAKLLRVLEEKIVVRVGGSKPIGTDVRVLAATNQDLAALVREKRFREDLYFRLNVVCLNLPPLRERGDDVILLARHFLHDFCARSRRDVPDLTPAAQRALLKHSWPGNVRELRNMMERIAYLHEGHSVDAPDLAFILSPQPSNSDLLALNSSLADATGEFQRRFIQRHIQQVRGNMTEAAEQLGLHRSNLYRKMRQLGMNVDDEGS